MYFLVFITYLLCLLKFVSSDDHSPYNIRISFSIVESLLDFFFIGLTTSWQLGIFHQLVYSGSVTDPRPETTPHSFINILMSAAVMLSTSRAQDWSRDSCWQLSLGRTVCLLISYFLPEVSNRDSYLMVTLHYRCDSLV